MELNWLDLKVQAALEILEAKGFPIEDVKLYSKDIIKTCIVPSAPVEAATLLLAAEKFQKQQEEERLNEQAYFIAQKFLPFVGRVVCKFDGGTTTSGTCVLFGPGGLTVTARHSVYDEKPSDQMVEGRGKKQMVSPHTIIVKYPNAAVGKVEYKAMIRDENVGEDLIILAPIHNLKKEPKYFDSWSLGERRMCTRVLLISYPDFMDKEFPSRKVQDMPTCDEGSIVLVTQRRIISTYCSFSGSSGGLVLKVDADDGLFGIGIHLAVAHHTDLLKVWNEQQLSLLNTNLGRKGCYGLATRMVASYLERFLHKHHADLAGAQLQRAARLLERPCFSEVVSIKDDLFMPWSDEEDEFKENVMLERKVDKSQKEEKDLEATKDSSKKCPETTIPKFGDCDTFKEESKETHVHESEFKSRGLIVGKRASVRQIHQGAAAKSSKSQGSELTRAELPDKIVVPKFGDQNAHDGRAQENFMLVQEKLKVPQKTPVKIVYPLRRPQEGTSMACRKRGRIFEFEKPKHYNQVELQKRSGRAL